MEKIRKRVKNLLENLSGYEAHHAGERSFTFISRKSAHDSWFLTDIEIKSIIKECNIDLVVDVGANEGQFALRMRSFYPGELFSFEPVSSVFTKLAATATADPRWHVNRMALGSQDGSQTIHVSDQTVFSSLLETNDYGKTHFGNGAKPVREEKVTVRRLDNILTELVPGIGDKRIFLKMDTQGYDSEVFRGLGRIAGRVNVLLSEVNLIPLYDKSPRWTENIAEYEKAGFSVAGMYPVNWDGRKVIEYDCLMIR
jgi:FkbM family methyltransferase